MRLLSFPPSVQEDTAGGLEANDRPLSDTHMEDPSIMGYYIDGHKNLGGDDLFRRACG